MQPFTYPGWGGGAGTVMVSLFSFYGIRKQGTNKMNSLVQYHPTWVSKKAEIPITVHNHGTALLQRGETSEQPPGHRSLTIGEAKFPRVRA